MITFKPVPNVASDYPDIAQTIVHICLPFYCCNCLRKAPTTYLTPNFGPFCADCIAEITPLLKDQV